MQEVDPEEDLEVVQEEDHLVFYFEKKRKSLISLGGRGGSRGGSRGGKN